MPRTRTDEASWWFDAVYSAVQQVPAGKVTSYGHIALLLGEPQRSRQVGVCLKHLPARNDGEAHAFHDGNVPWQRIINSKGQISPRGPGSAQRQATALRRERVTVTRNAMGEHCIDFATFGWFPKYLPSDAAEHGSESESESDNEGDDTNQANQTSVIDTNATAAAQAVRGHNIHL